jgi:peptide/nickel transport system permease protein
MHLRSSSIHGSTEANGMRFRRFPRISPLVLVALALICGIVALAAAAPAACPAGPWVRAAAALQPPSRDMLAGTDDIGRSVICLTLYGLRTSLEIGVAAGAMALFVGVAVGMVAGFVGGWPDLILMRVAELAHTIPRLFLAILAAALFEPHIAGLVLVLGLTSWGMLARVARAEAIALSGREFVVAARALGLSTTSLLLRHMLPNLLRPLMATAGPTIAGAIVAEAALGYVGLGDPDSVSLGRSIATAYPFLESAWWISATPVVALVALTLALVLLAETPGERYPGAALA